MKKVITYGTYDLLHYGHIKLLERARALGDYLIVGVTADDFDRSRGKINVKQSLIERVQAVRETGIADMIIVEEYEGQKIDDIKRLDVDIFTVGSDWIGKFDYLNEYCDVVYLDRTQGISSSQLRTEQQKLTMGAVGESPVILKFIRESQSVNGIAITMLCSNDINHLEGSLNESRSKITIVSDFQLMLQNVDSVYVASHPSMHYYHIRTALEQGKHVLCESPIALKENEAIELFNLAQTKGLILTEALKTAYSTAFGRMILLAKSGKIGDIISVDSVCTSLKNIDFSNEIKLGNTWNSFTSWAPTALLPIFQLVGIDFISANVYTRLANEEYKFDDFTKIAFLYSNAVASIKVGKGVKSEGELIISGTRGYIYIPAPWWKTEYFEIRYEDPTENKRYFYQLDGEGIPNELISFQRQIEQTGIPAISKHISITIARMMEEFHYGDKIIRI